MKLLLDTHILLWAAAEPEQLSSQAKTLIENLTSTKYLNQSIHQQLMNFYHRLLNYFHN